MSSDGPFRQQLSKLLDWEEAHVGFETAVADLPLDVRGKQPPGLPYSVWQLVEHIRIAQHDILEFSRNAKHVSPEWPVGYWPKSVTPPNAASWDESVRLFRRDLKAMQKLVANPKTDLLARIAWGDGQTILREALLLADHNAYHVAQFVDVRRLLGAWEG